MTGPLKQMSDTLTDQTDVHVEGVDVVVTKGPAVEGNEVTLRVQGGDGEDVLLGFDADGFDEFVARLTDATDSGGERA